MMDMKNMQIDEFKNYLELMEEMKLINQDIAT